MLNYTFRIAHRVRAEGLSTASTPTFTGGKPRSGSTSVRNVPLDDGVTWIAETIYRLHLDDGRRAKVSLETPWSSHA